MNDVLARQVAGQCVHAAASVDLSVLFDVLGAGLLDLLAALEHDLASNARIVRQEDIRRVDDCIRLLLGDVRLDDGDAHLILDLDGVVSLPFDAFQVLGRDRRLQILRFVALHVRLLITLDEAAQAA